QRRGPAEPAAVVAVLRWACAAGAACAQRLGASSALPTREEIDALYARTWPAPAPEDRQRDVW
ncbi:hypothetical protein I0C86_42640, partial [Plantactinospora sp. S1510]|nr:hypothetical protein [Plantactinospora alkalitolerans]